ncbi:histone transcription regulator HIRA, WD repeat superfamily [Piedraia hortae CBS 480.64]|uniref:Protein HIR n=1 Tax=Piedraia hortae CBS 480.64 TaxID=1314780 RepID=A0A6A7BX67_9PEZI|nr:histone transcription regulator HIRA, WD repeat superfamily [Piedraia hortae CBS 480.64]
MRFVKPHWLVHGGEKKDHEAYSCHVSPDGKRLATAAGDGHVRIWSTEAILSDSDDGDKPRQLASLSYHSGTVHSVRFSANGKYLASGADDKIVCVYTLEPGAPGHSTFGSNETPAVENWRIFRRLIGHDNDVQDLGWSSDCSILVSVGLDSKVVVWSGSTFEKLKTLSQHQSHVKGVTFDPANKYFATASDDRSIRLYRFTSPPPNATAYDQTSNFTLEKTITDPFDASPLTTYFRRCSWSPEGAHIAAANATNGPVSSVAIIARGTWASDINLIGHEGPVEVCAFSPRLFLKEPPDPNGGNPMPVSIVACAGQDKTVSVWNTSFPRPFVTVGELAAKSISDLAWCPEGDVLYLTSLDGTIAAIQFDAGEMGYPTEKSENEKALTKFGAGRRAGIVDGPDAQRLEDVSKEGELKVAETKMGELMGDGAALTISDTVNSVPITNGHDQTPPKAAPKEPPKDAQQERVEKLKNRVTFTKDGKKRIAPVLVSDQGESNMPRPRLQASVSSAMSSDEPMGKVLDLSRPYEGLPKGGVTSLLFGNKRKYAEVEGDTAEERKQAERRAQNMQQSGAAPILANTSEGLAFPGTAETSAKPSIHAALPLSQLRLAVPSVRNVILRPLDPTKPLPENDGEGDNPDAIVLEARNDTGPSRTGRPSDRAPTRMTVTRRTQVVWSDFLPRPVLLVTGNRNFWAAACDDGSLHTWTPAGRRMLNGLVLESQAVILDCRGWYLLAVTAVGTCHVWDLQRQAALHPPASLAPVLNVAATLQQDHLTSGPSLLFARLNSLGRVVVAMSNGDGFAYNASMLAWQKLSEPWWSVGSQYWNTTDTSVLRKCNGSGAASGTETSYLDELSPENLSAGILPLLERSTTSQSLLRGRAYFLQRTVKQLLSAEGYENFESSVSIAHLENRLAAARMLGARQEFRVYLIMYAKRLAAESLRGKAEELLNNLMPQEVGLWGSERDSGGENDAIMGWEKTDLMKEVVTILGKQRDLQRCLVPYAKAVALGVDGV